MSKLCNNSGILGCKSPQKSGNSPQTVGKMVLPAQECENLENPTCSTQLATPFAASEQGVAGGKSGNGVVLGVAERCYVAGDDETGSILSGSSIKTQQTGINTHKCFVQKVNKNTNTAGRTAKKQAAGVDFCYGSARKSRAHAGDKLEGNNCENTLVSARGMGGKFGNGAVEQGHAGVKYSELRCGAENGSVLNESSNMDKLKKADLSKFETQKSALGTAKKHSKVLRAVACGCLAILMCGTAFLGTACGGNAASMNAGQGSAAGAEQNFATQGGGLITPRADDPVIFETKDGLEIKFGQALPATFNTSLNTGNLAGFPYFTTNDGSTDYIWVIIGQNLAPTDIYSAPLAMLFDVKADSEYIYDTATNRVVQYRNVAIRRNSEIPLGCVLVLANEAVSNSLYGTSTRFDPWPSAPFLVGMPVRFVLDDSIGATMNTYYMNNAFGLSSVKNAIQQVRIVTHEFVRVWQDNIVDTYIFVMGREVVGNNFVWSSYLTANQMKLSSNQFLRGSDAGMPAIVRGDAQHYYASIMNNAGAEGYIANYTDTAGNRPAFCMSFN